MQILLVEDDLDIRKALVYMLEKEKYKVFTASTKKQATSFLESMAFDLVILDVYLPDGNGFDLYEQIIHKKRMPTLFLTAKDEEDAIVKGLDLGAEDYMTKPFSSRELLARIKRIIARTKKNNKIQVKDITFDLDKMVVYKNNIVINLTSLELQILYLLFTNLNKVVTRNHIIDKIWDLTGNDVNDNTVTVYVKKKKKKLDTNIILTIKGIGYRVDTHE